MAEEMKECPFCAETIKAKAIYCRFCGHYLDGREQPGSGDEVDSDEISAGDLKDVSGTAVGRESMAASTGDVEGTFIQTQGDVTLGKKQRDEQYEIALNWEARGKPRMRGFDLAERNLSQMSLANADLQHANLRSAILGGSVLSGIDLRGADLIAARLRYSRLRRADLSGAILIAADLSGANLCGANLNRAILTGADLNGVRYDEITTWPEGFDPVGAGAILVDDEGYTVEE